MKLIVKSLVIVFLFLNFSLIFSQIKNDKILNNYLIQIEQNRFTDSTKTKKILNEALIWSTKIKSKSAESTIHSWFCMLNRSNETLQTNSKSTEFHLLKALKFAKESNDNYALANAFLEKGLKESHDDDYDLSISSLLQANDYASKTIDTHLQTMIFYALSGLYKKIGDFDNLLATAKLCMQKADLSLTKNSDLAYANYILGVCHITKYEEEKNKNEADFKKSLLYFKKCISYANQPTSYRKNHLTEANYNIAVLYLQKDKVVYKDSVFSYLNKSSLFAEKYQHTGIYCMSRLMKIRYGLEEKNFNEVERLLKEVNVFQTILENNYKILNGLEMCNAKYYEARGNSAQALIWSKNFIFSSQKLYNLERNLTVKKAEAKYINKAKILELEQTKKDINRERNQKYLGFTLFVLTGLLFFGFYKNYKAKQREQKLNQNLLEKQKIEAELFSKLKDEESKKVQLESQFEQQQKETYQKQLMASVLQIESKNKILIDLKNELENSKEDHKKINRIIDNGIALDDDFENFKQNFENVYPKFFSKLQQKANNDLTQLDLKYCAYINMGLNAKEIGNLLHVETTSVRMARYRLKQKLALEKEEDLTSFINSIR